MLDDLHPAFWAIIAALLATAIVVLVNVPHINTWEKQHGYPYGKMCNSVFTFYVDTCKH